MVTRKENGNLGISDLDVQCFFDDLFEVCKTEKEVMWVLENLQSSLEICADDRINNIENEADE